MTYRLELPEDVDDRLSAHALATGEDVVELIERVITRFGDGQMPVTAAGKLLPRPAGRV